MSNMRLLLIFVLTFTLSTQTDNKDNADVDSMDDDGTETNDNKDNADVDSTDDDGTETNDNKDNADVDSTDNDGTETNVSELHHAGCPFFPLWENVFVAFSPKKAHCHI
ncbi:uncharacterized protein M6D78_013263 isoform 4-T8 [Vipera latastei]